MNSLLEQLQTSNDHDRQAHYNLLVELLAMDPAPEGAVAELAEVARRLGMTPADVQDLAQKVGTIRGHLRELDQRATAAQRRKATRQNYIHSRQLYQQIIEAMDAEIKAFYVARLHAEARSESVDTSERELRRLRLDFPELVAAAEKSHVAQPAMPEIPELPREQLLHPCIPALPAPKPAPTPEPVAVIDEPEADEPKAELAASASEPPLLAGEAVEPEPKARRKTK